MMDPGLAPLRGLSRMTVEILGIEEHVHDA
jgi:hypothetical protein